MSASSLLDMLTLGLICAVFTVGLKLCFTVHRVFHLALAVVFLLARGGTGMLVSRLGLPEVLALGISSLCAALLGMLAEQALLGPLRTATGSPSRMTLASLGLAAVLASLLPSNLDGETLAWPAAAVAATTTGARPGAVLCCSLVILSLAAILLVWRTGALGRFGRAVGESPTHAHLLGVPVKRIHLRFAGIGAGLAGMAGALTAVAGSGAIGITQLLCHAAVVMAVSGSELWVTVAGAVLLVLAEALLGPWLPWPLRPLLAPGLLLALLLRPGAFRQRDPAGRVEAA